MKNGAPKACRVVALGSLLFTIAPLHAQAPTVEKKLLALVESMQTVGDGDVGVDAVAKALASAQDYLDALGKSPERVAIDLLVDDLKAHKSGPFLIADKSVTRLLDEVCYQRTRGRPQRMLPALLALRSRYPEDPRVLYALGEAYGIASPVFDAERAHESFHTLLEALRERSEVATEPVGRGRSLAQFLPELTKAGLLLSERPTDTTARLRQHLLQLCETLQSGRPIGLWKLADPQLDRLYEQLSLARTRLDQERCREVLEAMLDMQPVNAVLRFALAEVYLSLGPAFDRNKAAENLEAFLHLTDPATLGGPDDRRPSVLTSADIVKDLERFRLAKPRSNLEEQRIQAHELLDAIGKTIRKRDDGLLLAPDREAIEKEVSKLEKSIKSKERYLVPALRNVAKFERKASNNRIPANVRVQNRQKAAQWQKKADKLNEEIDGFRARLNELQAVLRR